ncbi:hypothetical protein IV203_030250 [Nitzschia inconspicua]|uniref:Uncharacterized protein n=1 Tax=Nitzschia inconspicua TaxID=303405 RepID=A0A9K3LS70_9STRA|nr:hypothetical protein IV203_030250 [Nitzschia inconspicua]
MRQFLTNWTGATTTGACRKPRDSIDPPMETNSVKHEKDPNWTAASVVSGEESYAQHDVIIVTSEPSKAIIMDGITTNISTSVQDEQVDQTLQALRAKRDLLRSKCEQLEELICDTRQENDLCQVQMTLTMGSLRSKLDCLHKDKKCLEEKCNHLGEQLYSLRLQQRATLDVTSNLETNLRRHDPSNSDEESLDIQDVIRKST